MAVAGCGFTPAYGPGGAADVLRDAVRVESGESVFDYRLRVAVEERIGVGDGYVLTLVARVNEVAAAVTEEGSITRFNLTGVADWTLRDSGGADIGAGQVSGFTGYLTTGSTVATEAARRDAAERLAVILAEQVVARLVIVAGAGG
jgi:LPS-assembly lipoprotein